MIFKSVSEEAFEEVKGREELSRNRLRYGIDFLDDATKGILTDDFVLIGAPSGVGKTQLCLNIALANLEDGKKVHGFFLESDQYEILRRLKYPLVMERFLSDPDRPRFAKKVAFDSWLFGDYLQELAPYEQQAAEFIKTAYRDFYIFENLEKFGLSELIEGVISCAKNSNLIIVDHAHYFDLENENENKSLKDIAKTCKDLARYEKVPILLVAHLRKRDSKNEEIVASQEEFHGSSDLFKIAKRVITVAPGRLGASGDMETFFRVAKNRFNQSPTKFIGREIFSPRRGGYERGRYQLGWANQKRSEGFAQIARELYPDWAHFYPGVDNSNTSADARALPSKMGKRPL